MNRAITPKDVDELNQQLAQAAPIALSVGLALAHRRGSAKLVEFQREKLRLAHKYGEDSERVREMELRLKAHGKMSAVLLTQSQRALVPRAAAEPDTFVLQGRVVDEEGRGKSGRTVAVVDDQGRTIAKTKTNPIGYFEFRLGKAKMETAKAAKPPLKGRFRSRKKPVDEVPPKADLTEDRIFVQVGDVLQREGESVLAGRSAYREIVVHD